MNRDDTFAELSFALKHYNLIQVYEVTDFLNRNDVRYICETLSLSAKFQANITRNRERAFYSLVFFRDKNPFAVYFGKDVINTNQGYILGDNSIEFTN